MQSYVQQNKSQLSDSLISFIPISSYDHNRMLHHLFELRNSKISIPLTSLYKLYELSTNTAAWEHFFSLVWSYMFRRIHLLILQGSTSFATTTEKLLSRPTVSSSQWVIAIFKLSYSVTCLMCGGVVECKVCYGFV